MPEEALGQNEDFGFQAGKGRCGVNPTSSAIHAEVFGVILGVYLFCLHEQITCKGKPKSFLKQKASMPQMA